MRISDSLPLGQRMALDSVRAELLEAAGWTMTEEMPLALACDRCGELDRVLWTRKKTGRGADFEIVCSRCASRLIKRGSRA
jgi:superfamily II helicase